MKFLVVTKPAFPIPMEMAPGLNEAMMAWVNEHTDSGKIEASWAFSGVSGGGGIINVDSLEELDETLMAFALAQFSEMEVFGLADLRARLDRFQAFYEATAPGQSPRGNSVGIAG